MKTVNAVVKFFITNANMEYLLKGMSIDNLDEIHRNLFSDIKKKEGNVFIYEPKISDPNHPDNLISRDKSNEERIVAKVLRFIPGKVTDDDALEIEVIDSLYFCKLREPVIKLNGLYTVTDPDRAIIHLDSINRITLADKCSL